MENSFLNNLRINSPNATPRLSDSEYKQLKEAYDANRAATSSAKGAAVAKAAEDAFIRLPIGLFAHLVDALELPFNLLNGEGSDGLAKHTNQVINSAGDPEASPSLKLLLHNNDELKKTGSDAKAYEKERNNRTFAKQLETAELIDPMNFLRNLRGKKS